VTDGKRLVIEHPSRAHLDPCYRSSRTERVDHDAGSTLRRLYLFCAQRHADPGSVLQSIRGARVEAPTKDGTALFGPEEKDFVDVPNE